MKEKIIVLRVLKFRESDLIVHGLNPLGGRMNFLARGGASSRKRFGGGILQPTHYILVHYRGSHRIQEDEAPLHNLHEAELIKGFPHLRDHLERLETALAMVQLVGKMAQPGVEDAPELFDLLGNGLYAAESSHHLDILRLQFEAKLLYLQGVLPEAHIMGEILQPTLKDHAQIQLSPEQFSQFQQEVRMGLQRYLQGLAPLAYEGLEI